MKVLNIGIIGTAEIARRSIIEPANIIDSINVYGIASRELKKAKKYTEKYNISNYFGSYNELLQNDIIDAVYIPLINSLHAEWTIKAIDAGKHVLVEKPICLSTKEVEDVSKAMDRNPGVFVMEGLMSQHHPWNNEIIDIIQSKRYGNLKHIKTRSCYKLNDLKDFRLYPNMGGSVFFEEALLWCHLTQICLGLNPIDIQAKCDFNGPFGGDHVFESRLQYDNGIVSECYCSYDDPYEANHYLEFDKAHLSIKNFWRPTFGFVKMNINIDLIEINEKQRISFEPQNYFFNQLNYFVESILLSRKNKNISDSFERIKLLSKIFKKANKKNFYEKDN